MFCMEKGVRVQWNMAVCPVKMYETTVADMAESKRGSREAMEMLNMRISMVNSIPAKGALKMPAMAPAAPHPSSTVMLA